MLEQPRFSDAVGERTKTLLRQRTATRRSCHSRGFEVERLQLHRRWSILTSHVQPRIWSEIHEGYEYTSWPRWAIQSSQEEAMAAAADDARSAADDGARKRWPPVSLPAISQVGQVTVEWHMDCSQPFPRTHNRVDRYCALLCTLRAHAHHNTLFLSSPAARVCSLSSQLCITVSMSASSNRSESGSSRSESGSEPIPESSVGSAVLSSIG